MSRRVAATVVAASLFATTVPVASAQNLTEHLPAEVTESLPFDIPQLRDQNTGSSVGAVPTQHAGAPTPQPFSPGALTGYISDISSYDHGVYAELIDGYDDLRANHPEVMAENLEITVDYNNNASPERVEKAQLDAAADQLGVIYAVSDALGAEFGQAFRDALDENRLPRTEFLLGNGYLARAGGLASAMGVEKLVYDTDRPFVVAPERIKRYESGERDFYEATPAFPSGHTNQATWITTLLAVMLPEVGPQLLERGSESGESRLVMGVHYPLDVIGGRMTGTAAAADRWNDPRMRHAIRMAGDEIRAEMKWRTGKDIDELVAGDTAYKSDEEAVAAYTERMTYGFDTVHATDAPMVVPQAAPDLLHPQFPELTDGQRAEILRQTALPAGYPLDKQNGDGSWQRINLAAAWAADVTVHPDGSVTVN